MGKSYAFQHKEGAYTYGKNTGGVTQFLKVHHIDQITLLSMYMRHLSDIEFKKENSVNPLYMENWKHMTFSHLVQFYEEIHIKLIEIGHPNIFNHITINMLKPSATITPSLDETSWFASILHVFSNF